MNTTGCEKLQECVCLYVCDIKIIASNKTSIKAIMIFEQNRESSKMKV